MVNGEFPGIPGDYTLHESTEYAINYIVQSSIEKLFTFTVSDNVLKELGNISCNFCNRIMGHEFKSLEIIKTLG